MVRTAQTSCPGRNAARSNPTECKNCNHWHSCQSVRRPGTFFMWRAFTKQGRMPRCSRISNSGIQYTPVDSSATVFTPALLEPIGQALQIFGEGCEYPHRFLVPPWRYGYKHFSCANVDTGCIRLQHRPVFQTHPFLSSPPLGLRVRRLQISTSCLVHCCCFLSCKQRPSCAIEGTLPIGISWLAPTVNHCSAHETWSHAVVRCSKTHHCHYGLLPLPVAPSQDA